MLNGKRYLLIAGGGTLGTYTSNEILRLGGQVDVICPEEKVSHDERLVFHQSLVSDQLLKELFAHTHYDGIVNFIHYQNAEDYKKVHPLLIQNTDHLIFLSSYRVYADEQHPITESAPRLLDVVKDPEFLEREDYALPKARCEDFLRTECAGQNWTIVRPVISFSALRLDFFMYSKHTLPERAKTGEPVIMPAYAKDLTAGLDWAGNSGKLIARLLLNRDTIGKTYTISSGQNLTWGQVGQLYTRLTGVEIRWETEEAFLQAYSLDKLQTQWMYYYDRVFDRRVDPTAVLEATGLKQEDMTPMGEGLRIELEKAGYPPVNSQR